MPRVQDIFASLRASGRKALMPFVCAGHPTRDSLPAVLAALERGGASVVEIGFPFSDPIADGPVIAAAMHEAIRGGTTPESVFEAVRRARAGLGIGLVGMVSVSLVHRCGGPEGFVRRAAEAGFDGLIVPDAPLEESGALMKAAAGAGLTYSHLISPTTPAKRAEQLAQACTGFVYMLARVGITGEQAALPNLSPMVARLRQATELPIAVGFGISTPEQVRAVVADADAAIVGSALVRRLSAAQGAGRNAAEEAEAFTRELAAGLGGA